MQSLKLEDFLPEILDNQDDEFSLKLAHQYRFAQYAAPGTEPPPKVGQKYAHQNFASEYFSIYRSALIAEAPGTGKTCLSSAVAETLKQILENEISSPVKKVFVLVKGKTLQENFKQEIVCRCTHNVYNKASDLGETARTQSGRVKKAIEQYYTFMTYGKFASAVTGKNAEQYAKYYSNVLVIVDEAHNLIAQSAEPGVKIDKTGLKQTYLSIWNFLHNAPGVKALLLTATPMRNSPDELGELLNLILPNDNQIKEVDGHLIEGRSDEELWPYFKGNISYLREMERKIKIEYMGKKLSSFIGGNYETIIYPCPMSKFQEEHYINVVKRSKRSGVYINPRQAANFVFPDGSVGTAGFKKFVLPPRPAEIKRPSKTKNYASRQFYEFTDEFKNYFRGEDGKIFKGQKFIDKLQEYSSPFSKTLQYAFDHPNEKCIDYEEYKTTSGGYVLVLLFELGLDYSILTPDVLEQQRQEMDYCSEGEVTSVFPPGSKKIGILTPELADAKRKTLINLYNSPKNVGKNVYFPFIVFTPVGREGLSFKNVNAVFLKGTWSPATEKQAEKRGLRSNSHQELEEILGEGNVTVKVFRLAIQLSPGNNNLPNGDYLEPEVEDKNENKDDLTEEEEEGKSVDEDDEEVDERVVSPVSSKEEEEEERTQIFNIDFHLFAFSETKERIMAPYWRLIKQSSFNCFNDRFRNQQNDLVDGSSECDFTNCKYPCQIGTDKYLNPFEVEYKLDYNSVWDKPPKDLTSDLEAELQEIFLDQTTIYLNDLVELLQKPLELLIPAITFLANSQVFFMTRWGYGGFLAISPTSLGLIPRIEGSIEDSVYFKTFKFSLPPESWASITSEEAIKTNRNELDKQFETSNSLISGLINKISNYPTTLKNYILERAFIIRDDESYSKDARKNAVAIIEHYRPKIFSFKYQDRSIVVSTLINIQGMETVKYSGAKKALEPKTFRIFDKATKTWSDPTPLEVEEILPKIIETIYNREKDLIESGEIYGFKLVDDDKNQLRIVDPETMKLKDKRRHRTGPVCSSSSASDRANYYWKLQIPLKMATPEVSIRKMKKDLDASNIVYKDDPDDEDDEERIKYLYTWHQIRREPKKANDDCKEIEQALIEKGRLIRR